MMMKSYALLMALIPATSLQGLNTATAAPFEPWGDPCGYPGIPSTHDANMTRLLDAEAVLIPANEIARNTGDQNFWHLTNTAGFYYYPGSNNLILDGPFLFETRISSRGRSGFLIAPDMVMTASHSRPQRSEFFDPSDYVVVLNMRSKKNSAGECVAPNLSRIPDSDVYIIPPGTQVFDLMTMAGESFDYAAFKLPRSVAGNKHLRLRRSGTPDREDVMALVGHPAMLRAKLHYGIHFDEYSPLTGNLYSLPKISPTYVLPGSSGGPLYNVSRGMVEGVLAEHIGCVAKENLPNSTSIKLVDKCNDPLSIVYPASINYGPIEIAASHLSTPELRTSPLNDVTYVVPGMPASVSTTYSIQSSPDVPGVSQAMALAELAPSGEPQLLSGSTVFANLQPGGSTSLTVTAERPSASLVCGTYDRFVRVADIRNTFYDVIRHRFEVRLTDFDVVPMSGNRLEGVVAPTVPSSLIYRISNKRQTPVSVTVSSQESWIRINQASAPYTISLAAQGSPGDQVDISVSLAASAIKLHNGTNIFHVNFRNNSQCPVSQEMTQVGEFIKGQVTISSGIPFYLATSLPSSSPAQSTITMPETFCISDMQLEVDLYKAVSDIGVEFSNLAPYFRVELDANGTSAALWEHNSIPANWSIPSAGAGFYKFLVDQQGNSAPQGPGLSIFNGRNSFGQWRISIWDDRISGIRQAANDWRLRVHGAPGACP